MLFRVFDTGMVDALEPFNEHLLRHSNIMEGNGAVMVEPFIHLPIYQFIDQLTDSFIGILIKRF